MALSYICVSVLFLTFVAVLQFPPFLPLIVGFDGDLLSPEQLASRHSRSLLRSQKASAYYLIKNNGLIDICFIHHLTEVSAFKKTIVWICFA